jgi:hypothetical protein
MSQQERGVSKIVIHSIFGALLGGGMGAWLWFYILDGAFTQGCVYSVGGGALVFGILAGLYLDEFWDAVIKHGEWPW